MEHTTKDRILDEALILFAEQGYKGANLRDLAARLGLAAQRNARCVLETKTVEALKKSVAWLKEHQLWNV